MSTIDVYQACVCGSGKKLKFCCFDAIDEITRIEAMLFRKQEQAAATAVESALKKHPKNLYLNIISIDLRHEDVEGAAESVAKLLEAHPDNPELLRRQAGYVMETRPLEESKEVVAKTIQKIYQSNPELVALLALNMGTRFWQAGHPMAARERYVIAMRMGDEELKRMAFSMLMEFDGGISPYPLRGPHFLLPVEGTADEAREVSRAKRMADLSCTASAVRIYRKLAEQRPNDGAVWHNLGLLLAWDGQPNEAIVALRRAVPLLSDREKGVEAETLALLLADELPEQKMKSFKKDFRSSNVALLISRLENSPQLSHMEDMEAQNQSVRAAFRIADREIPQYTSEREWSTEDFPQTFANLIIAETADEAGFIGYVATRTTEALEDVAKLLKQTAGDELIEFSQTEAEVGDIALPPDYETLFPPVALPRNTPGRIVRQFRYALCEATLERWKNLPLVLLDNRSPIEAASDPTAYPRLRALITELDTIIRLNEGYADVEKLYAAIGIEPPPPLEIEAGQAINSLTSLEIVRLKPDTLTDEQLRNLQPRALLIGNDPCAYRILSALVNRPHLIADPEEFHRTLQTLSKIALRMNKFEEALDWLSREVPGETLDDESRFIQSAHKALGELQIRILDPQQSGLKELLERIHRNFSRKLPQLMQALTTQILLPNGINPPWSQFGNSLDLSATSMGNQGTEGLWTPGAATGEESGSQKKLWIPGT